MEEKSTSNSKFYFFDVRKSVHHHTIQIKLASRIRMEHPDPARKLSANLYDIYHWCVYSGKLLMMDRGTVPNM
jgi:hypothetical protein